jgi:hypothetical protein
MKMKISIAAARNVASEILDTAAHKFILNYDVNCNRTAVGTGVLAGVTDGIATGSLSKGVAAGLITAAATWAVTRAVPAAILAHGMWSGSKPDQQLNYE